MSTRSRPLLGVLALAIGLVWATPALAHPGHGGHSFSDGWLHPLTGLDHLLAMVAVGLLAVRMGGKALWIMPAAFLGCMMVGGLLASAGIGLDTGSAKSAIEFGIAGSVLVLGLMIAATAAVPLKYGAALVAFFALLHGHSHMAELPVGASPLAYASGFLLATALLHIAGIVGGLALVRFANRYALRIAGGLIAAAGLLLMVLSAGGQG